jgi:glycosyltransferase involved in cell wall biosynthesis
MKNENTIAITNSFGNPENSKTWSGTPSNIIKALKGQGYNLLAIDASINNRFRERYYRLVHKLYGFKFDYHRGKLPRLYRARISQEQSLAKNCNKILHTGTLDLPLSKVRKEVEHYLFCDSTWNLWSQYATNIDQYPTKMLKLAEELEQESYSQIKHFFPISEYVRNNLVNYYGVNPNQITVVGTGRGSIQAFAEEKDYENGHILFVAKDRFDDKGGPLLLEGFKIAQRQNPNLNLVIVGDDKYREQIGVIPNVMVTGYISWEELQNLFNTAALFAMPAVNEPWGLVYLEALACRTPILGLNRNSLPEITCQGEYGFLVDEPNADQVADAILSAFSNPDKLREMGLAGQKYCLEKFSWDQVASTITSVMMET